GVTRPSRPLLLRLLGSVGPLTMGVSMAPRVPRAVPQGRPASRGSVIVSSETDYNTEGEPRARSVPDRSVPDRRRGSRRTKLHTDVQAGNLEISATTEDDRRDAPFVA